MTADELEANLIENAKLPIIPIDSNETDYNPGKFFFIFYDLFFHSKIKKFFFSKAAVKIVHFDIIF